MGRTETMLYNSKNGDEHYFLNVILIKNQENVHIIPEKYKSMPTLLKE